MEQLEFKFDKREFLEDKIRREYAEFKSIEDVWAAARFAYKHEPDKDWREHRRFHIPSVKEIRLQLKGKYPTSKKDINSMKSKQVRWVYFNLRNYEDKINSLLISLRGYQ
ncbi:MAG: hypothetical protein KKA65_02550 [Nanoarchaeota archaeon]|nr:hypothetical protein [Nanoarchaeota archaeon]MBU4456357.1 hypothetical protein [Nanoarchaeota archaeon]MCG2719276.1 hypothetical protein [Nanoarchaeota archaeon]